MDNGVLDAEADVDRQSRREAPLAYRESAGDGENAALLATGGFDSEVAADEETPLLSRDPDVSSTGKLDGGVQDANQDSVNQNNGWAGQAEFDSLPCWRRPSVCTQAGIP